MMDHFLNSLLQVVIVLDVLGLLAYFALGSLRAKKKLAPIQAPAAPGFWARLRQRIPATAMGQRSEDLDAALGNLKRVLYSYQQGLA
ncbi:MAG: hypothetical protein HYW07_17745 [Candidatus Latescibacteria bacterium]|nr:hypothetical protein [Candidatus Latescibacterota bacterium]